MYYMIFAGRGGGRRPAERAWRGRRGGWAIGGGVRHTAPSNMTARDSAGTSRRQAVGMWYQERCSITAACARRCAQ